MAHMRGGIRTTQPQRRDRTEPTLSGRSRDEEQQYDHCMDTHKNVGKKERLISGLIGSGLLLHGLRPPMTGLNALKALIGIAFLQRSVTGHCLAYDMFGMSTHDRTDTSSIGRPKVQSNRALKIERSIRVQRPAKDLYAFWRQLDNLPTIMSQVRSVETVDDRRSHWIINTLPGAPTVEWDAEIINEIEDERIGWRTLSGAMVEHAGSVRFKPLKEGQTLVTVTLQYDPPAGAIGAAIADLLGQEPGQKIARDLERFKEAMESQSTASR